MAVLTLRELFDGNVKKNLVIIEVYVHKMIDRLTFIVGDSTGTAQLSTKKNPRLTDQIRAGASKRIIKPELESNLIVLTEDTKLFECNTIQAQPMTEAEQELNDASFTSFDDLDQFVAGANIPSLVGKVLFMSPSKKAKYSPRIILKVS